MDTVSFAGTEVTPARLQRAVTPLLDRWERFLGPESDVRIVSVRDGARGRYLLIHEGHDRQGYAHITLVHLELRNGKVWILRNETEEDLAQFLMREGIERENIVLGFLSPAMRAYSDYAVS